MSDFDDMGDSSDFLPYIGWPGLIAFGLLAWFAYSGHKEAMENGYPCKVVSLGTARDGITSIRVECYAVDARTPVTQDRETGSRDVFVGDTLTCGRHLSDHCYKDSAP